MMKKKSWDGETCKKCLSDNVLEDKRYRESKKSSSLLNYTLYKIYNMDTQKLKREKLPLK